MELDTTSQQLREAWQKRRAALDSLQQLGQTSVSDPITLFENLQLMGEVEPDQSRRPLFVDFFALGPDNVAVFLIPLWQSLSVKAGTLELSRDQLAATVSNFVLASANLSKLTRARKTRRAYPTLTLEESKARLREALNGLQSLADPWLKYLDQLRPTELVFSPTSLVNLMPLHAIQLHNRPLIGYLPISYLPSASLAGLIASRKSQEFTLATVIGDPHNDLGGSRREATTVAAQLQAAGIKTSVYLSEEASSETLLRDTSHADILHFACHSSLEDDNLERSGIELADRRLTVLDITARLRVSGTQLIYLSSCDSAQTSLERPEELGAIARAFFVAGARSMIASLWAVDDDASALFADRFYRYCLNDNMALSFAFRQAMLDVQRADPDPVKWAPFVLIGAWHTQIAGAPGERGSGQSASRD